MTFFTNDDNKIKQNEEVALNAAGTRRGDKMFRN